MSIHVFQRELDSTLANESGLVGREKSNLFIKLPKTRRPAIKNAQLKGSYGQARNSHQPNDTDEDKVSVGFLFNVFTKK